MTNLIEIPLPLPLRTCGGDYLMRAVADRWAKVFEALLRDELQGVIVVFRDDILVDSLICEEPIRDVVERAIATTNDTIHPLDYPRGRIYQYIIAYKHSHNGNSPSIQDIAKAEGFSKSNTWAHILQLQKLRALSLDGSKNIAIPDTQWGWVHE